MKEGMQEVRRKLQGRAAATLNILGEPKRAFEIAQDEAERTLSALRLFSRQMMVPGALGTASQLGVISPQVEGYFALKNSLIAVYSIGVASSAIDSWCISEQEIIEMFRQGLGTLHELLLKDDPTGFEKDLLDSIALYTRAAATTNVSDRLMYVFSSLESFLLRDVSENLQQNIAERIAFAISKDGVKRRAIVKSYKAAYGLRSKYVHHGRSIEDNKQLDAFFFEVWTFYMFCIHNHSSFTSTAALLDYIESQKYD
jgi:hypothetical protein